MYITEANSHIQQESACCLTIAVSRTSLATRRISFTVTLIDDSISSVSHENLTVIKHAASRKISKQSYHQHRRQPPQFLNAPHLFYSTQNKLPWQSISACWAKARNCRNAAICVEPATSLSAQLLRSCGALRVVALREWRGRRRVGGRRGSCSDGYDIVMLLHPSSLVHEYICHVI